MISQENQYEKIVEYREHLSNWLKRYDFQWFVTMRVPTGNEVSIVPNAERLLKIWRRNLCKENKIQICHLGIIVISRVYGIHMHLLLSGRNKYGQTLLDMSEREWENEWSRLTKLDCHIQTIRDNGIAEYLASPKNTPPKHELVIPYNQYLLNKFCCHNS